jgi:outer membrane receptor for ferric coprogen and ferric-rhodotorulic acid
LNGGSAEDNPARYQIPDISLSRFGVGPDWSRLTKNVYYGRASMDHSFQSDWKLRASLQYYGLHSLKKYAWVGNFDPISADPGDSTDMNIYLIEERNPAYSGEVNLFGDVEIMGREHTLFFGIDAARVGDQDVPALYDAPGLSGDDVRNAFGYDPDNPGGVFLGSGEGVTYEAGLKAEFLGERLFWSVALFNTALTNITQQDPAGITSPFGPKFGLTAFTSYQCAPSATRSRGAPSRPRPICSTSATSRPPRWRSTVWCRSIRGAACCSR